MKSLHIVSFILLIVGGLNWGLYALGYNAVDLIFGAVSMTKVVYILIALAAIYEVAIHKKNCRTCGAGGMV